MQRRDGRFQMKVDALNAGTAAVLVADLASREAATPFDSERLALLAELSASLLRDPESRNWPELVAFAFAIRPAELQRLKRDHEASVGPGTTAAARGIVLHFAPANVATVGSLSWVWSFLTGNANVVRVSTRRGEVAARLESAISTMLSGHRLAPSNRWVSYDHDPAITEILSRGADVRMIWGGNRAVEEIRPVRSKPGTLDLVFRDRVSIAVLDARAIAALDDGMLRDLVSKFVADVILFDQAACSSPKVLFWVGPGSLGLSERWWAAVLDELAARDYVPPEGATVRKLGAASVAAMTGAARRVSTLSPSLTILEADADRLISDHGCGWGFIEQRQVDCLEEILPSLHSGVQTVSTAGFGEEIAAFAQALARKGVDRVVPVGTALQFGRYWDGFDLFQVLTRRVQIATA